MNFFAFHLVLERHAKLRLLIGGVNNDDIPGTIATFNHIIPFALSCKSKTHLQGKPTSVRYTTLNHQPYKIANPLLYSLPFVHTCMSVHRLMRTQMRTRGTANGCVTTQHDNILIRQQYDQKQGQQPSRSWRTMLHYARHTAEHS